MFVHNVLVAAICIKLVYYVYAMLSLCLLSHGLDRVEGKLFKSGQKCENWPSKSNGDASCHPVLSCQLAIKNRTFEIFSNILSVETVMNGLWPVGVEEVGKHYGTNEAIYEINWNWSELDISMWGKGVYWQKCKLVQVQVIGIGVFTTFFLKHLSSPWPSSSLCASNGGRRMARNPVEKEHFNISTHTGFCQTIPDDIMSVWMQITLTLSDSLLRCQGQESTSKLSYKSLSNFRAVVN